MEGHLRSRHPGARGRRPRPQRTAIDPGGDRGEVPDLLRGHPQPASGRGGEAGARGGGKTVLEFQNPQSPEAQEELRQMYAHGVKTGREVVVVSTLPPQNLPEGSVVLTPEFRFGPEDRGRTLSPEELAERFQGFGHYQVYSLELLKKVQEVPPERLEGVYRLLAQAHEGLQGGAERVVVTRHEGTVELLRREGVVDENTPVLPHATPEDVKGKVVIGVVPHALASEAEAVQAVSLNLPRGAELGADEVAEVVRNMGYSSLREYLERNTYVLLNLKDPEVLRALLETPTEGVPEALARAVEGARRSVEVEVDPEWAKRALEGLGERLKEAVQDGYNGWPTPSLKAVEETLSRAAEERKLDLEDLYQLRKALERLPEELRLEGANSWAAGRVVDPLWEEAERLADRVAPRERELSPGL